MARSRRTPAMFVGRCFWGLFDRKLQRKIKKSQTPSAAEGSAVPRTLRETWNSILKQNCHLASPACLGAAAPA
jgi:hypothetical protein